MRVLIACEFSGRVREAFRERGHDAWSCDLLPSEDNSVYHIQADMFKLDLESFDLMIAHPPCTYLASSGLHWNKRQPERATKTEESVEFVQRIMDAPVARIAVENLIGCLSTRIRKPDQIIQPHWFGEDASKSTCLWLKDLPELEATYYVPPRYVCCGRVLDDAVGLYGCPHCLGDNKPKARWGNQTNSGQNRLGPSPDRWKERSRTFTGIADAMAAQWG